MSFRVRVSGKQTGTGRLLRHPGNLKFTGPPSTVSRSHYNSLPNSASPDPDDWHLPLASQSTSRSRLSTPTGRRPVVETIKSGPDLLPKCQRAREREATRRHDDMTTASANTVVRIHGVIKETQSNQPDSREASSRTYVLAENSRHHQGDALAVPCASGYRGDWARHGQVEGDVSSGAQPVYL